MLGAGRTGMSVAAFEVVGINGVAERLAGSLPAWASSSCFRCIERGQLLAASRSAMSRFCRSRSDNPFASQLWRAASASASALSRSAASSAASLSAAALACSRRSFSAAASRVASSAFCRSAATAACAVRSSANWRSASSASSRASPVRVGRPRLLGLAARFSASALLASPARSRWAARPGPPPPFFPLQLR